MTEFAAANDWIPEQDSATRLFRLPRSFRRRRFLDLLVGAGYSVTPIEEFFVRDLYWDTQDGRLHKSLRRFRCREVNRRRLWHLLENGSRVWELAAEGESVPTGGPVGDKLASLLKARTLLPLFRIQTRTARYEIQGPGETRFEMTLYINVRFTLPDSSGEVKYPPFLSLVLLQGDAKEARYLSVLLRDRASLVPDHGDLFEIALRSLGLPPPGAPVPSHLLVQPEDPMAVAGRKVVGQQLYKMRANTDGTLRDLDIEFLHDLRVATRRARSALQLLGEILGPARSKALRKELGWIAGVLGGVRDMDVFIPGLDPRFDAARIPPEGRAWILDSFRLQRETALAEVRNALTSRRFATLLVRLERLASSPPPKRPVSFGGLPASEVGLNLVGRASKKVLKWARKIGEEPDEDALHNLRILFKKLRYTGEFFRSALNRDPAKELKLLVKIQDCLGDHQDTVVAEERLRDLGIRAAAENVSPDRLLEIGALIQTERDSGRECRMRFQELWHQFREAQLAK